MRFYSFDAAPLIPVSHDPQLKKKVLVGDGVSCVSNLSHIALAPGDKATAHSHGDACEVFYCIRGRIFVSVEGKEAALKKGDCLVIEPGERHAITGVAEETELLYFFARTS